MSDEEYKSPDLIIENNDEFIAEEIDFDDEEFIDPILSDADDPEEEED